MKRVFLVLFLGIVVLAFAGCGGSPKVVTTPTSTPGSPNAKVLGSWIVKGQSGGMYDLTFYPDGTFHLINNGEVSIGKYAVSGDTVTVSPYGAAPFTLKLSGNTLTGEVTWTRV
jgi:hypothetical protein